MYFDFGLFLSIAES